MTGFERQFIQKHVLQDNTVETLYLGLLDMRNGNQDTSLVRTVVHGLIVSRLEGFH